MPWGRWVWIFRVAVGNLAGAVFPAEDSGLVHWARIAHWGLKPQLNPNFVSNPINKSASSAAFEMSLSGVDSTLKCWRKSWMEADWRKANNLPSCEVWNLSVMYEIFQGGDHENLTTHETLISYPHSNIRGMHLPLDRQWLLEAFLTMRVD